MVKKRCNRFKELSLETQENLIQEYLESMKDEKTARTFAVQYYIEMGANFNATGSMSDPY